MHFRVKLSDIKWWVEKDALSVLPACILALVLVLIPSLFINPKYLPQCRDAPKRPLCAQQRRRSFIPRSWLADARTQRRVRVPEAPLYRAVDTRV